MNPERLVIFDYSGTLSRGAVLFARQESLMKHLTESGLGRLGIDNCDVFWREIVNATWDEGSTTSTGYTELIVKRLREISPHGETMSLPHMEAAAFRFVHAYLTHSAPDRPWKPLLARLAAHPRTCLLIATDHYAEATGYIIDFLEAMGIPAKRAREFSTKPAGDAAFVANSADMGYPKADRLFWEILKSELPLNDIRRILLVDDFGCNESEGDDYGITAKVAARKDTTTCILAEVFTGDITVLPFLIPPEKREPITDDHNGDACEELINSTIQQVEAWLSER
ncbi:MAG: hypothetical protein JXR85_02125 [Deltaproteobacteria bacterium]|nr:hypothetical protein [Deltaproteobacteria bacterium]